MPCTASLLGGSGQCNSCNKLPNCLGAVGNGTPVTHCLTALRQWAVELLQCTASLPGSNGHWNSCDALPHCLGSVASASLAIHCRTAWGHWAVEFLQRTAVLPRIHHCPGGTPRTRGLAAGGPHTSVPQYGPRSRSPPATSIHISPALGSMPCWTRWMRRQGALRTPAPTPWDGSALCKNPASVSPTRASRSSTPYLTRAAPCSPPTTPTLRLPCLSATPPSASTPPPSAMASSHGETTSRSPASASPCSPPGTRPVPSASYPPPGTTSSPARLTRSSAPTSIGGLRPGSPRGVVPGATVRPLLGVPSSFGGTNPSCWLWKVPQPTTPSPPTLSAVSEPSPRRTGMPCSTGVCVLRISVAFSATSSSLPSPYTNGTRCLSCLLPTTSPPGRRSP